ncbi:MAG: hypothetical protein ACRCZF_19160, partial [Gemmataceae bacterium]
GAPGSGGDAIGGLGAGGGFGGGGPGGPTGGGRGAMPAKPGLMKADQEKKSEDALQERQQRRRSGVVDKAKEYGANGREDAKDFFFAERNKALADQLVLFRKLDPTREWAENNYDKRRMTEQLAALVAVNRFWVAYAEHDDAKPFLSAHLPEAGRNFTEAMLALAVLDLPFTAAKPDYKFDAGKMTYTPAGPTIVFHEEVKPTGPPVAKVPVLVSQNFYKPSDRFRMEAGERIDKFITEEFVAQTVYGCQVVVTNTGSARQRLTVLLQIPVGAIAVAKGRATRTQLLDLEPYRTQTIDYQFYFPASGDYPHYPVHVAKNEAPIAAAAPLKFHVVAKATKADTQSWEYVSQNGTTEEVVKFLTEGNVAALNLDLIAFRMKDANVFRQVTELLAARHQYHHTLWSYAMLHNVPAAVREFLLHAEVLADEAGPLNTPILVNDLVARHRYEHLEYKPIVNARAHSLGARRQIVNTALHEQYHRFLTNLSFQKEFTDDDRATLTYYLLLQDRFEEAQTSFAQIRAEKLSTKMQYDYCAAFLDLLNDPPAKARGICEAYANHPVDRWRNAFASIREMLDEAEGKAPNLIDKNNVAERQALLAAQQPAHEFRIVQQQLQLSVKNVEKAMVHYYLMDVELLFSRNPFVAQTGDDFALIRPNRSEAITIPAGATKHTVPLPAEYVKKNVLVEIVAGGKTVRQTYYASAMDVKFVENYGQLTATNAATGKPLAKVYVKAYTRTADGQVKFHKDGYTDHRGRFDYATVSTPEKSAPVKFAVLVLSEEFGAAIQEKDPPKQ